MIDLILMGRGHVDDIAIFSMTFSEHLNHVREVLTRLRDTGLTVNCKKCTCAAKSVKYLENILKDGAIKADDDKVSAIMNITPAKTMKGLRVILVIPDYYRPIFPCIRP